jgi:hypothetical protein
MAMTRKEVEDRLATLARTNVTDVVEEVEAPWGVSYRLREGLTREQLASVSEITPSKVKLHSSMEALKQIRAMEGYDAPVKHEVQNTVEGRILEHVAVSLTLEQTQRVFELCRDGKPLEEAYQLVKKDDA